MWRIGEVGLDRHADERDQQCDVGRGFQVDADPVSIGDDVDARWRQDIAEPIDHGAGQAESDMVFVVEMEDLPGASAHADAEAAVRLACHDRWPGAELRKGVSGIRRAGDLRCAHDGQRGVPGP